ncbi:nucleotidyltransferase, partial [Trifolium medium]|nr:nucleotidyltransferase [Trifolium medium]
SPAEQLEFGSLGPMGFSGANELPQPNEGSRSGNGALEEQRFHGGPAQRSSPDQPSSPHVSRGPDSNVR